MKRSIKTKARPAAARNRADDEIRLVGGGERFLSFLKAALQGDADVRRFKTMKAALAGRAGCRAFVFLPDYLNGARCLPETDFETIRRFSELRRQGQVLYVENYDAGDYTHSAVFGHLVDAGPRCFFTECVAAAGDWKDRLPDGNILQARGAFYLPGRAMMFHAGRPAKSSVLLEASDCIGTHKVFRAGTASYPVLVRLDNYFTAVMNLAEFDPLMQLPFFRWRAVFSLLFSRVLGVSRARVEKAFDSTWRPIGTAGGGKMTLKPGRAAIERAVERAVAWHERSGVISEPSGRHGCFEMIRSQNLKVRANLRMDAQMLAGLLLFMQGRREGNRGRMLLGERLVRHMLDNGIQIEKGYARGLFKWFLDFGDGPDYVWANDTARGGFVMLMMHALTGRKEYGLRALALGDGILRWLGRAGRHCLSFKISACRSMEDTRTPGGFSENPIFYAEMASFLLQLYRAGGQVKYKRAALKFALPIIRRFPKVKASSFSSNFIYSRTMLMLCCIQDLAGLDCSDKINLVLDYLEKLQHSSGGIAEPQINILSGAEAGVGIGDGSDNIADLLYCNNFFACALGVLARTRRPFSVNMPKAESIYRKLLRFLVNVQIVSPDPRLDGGWMRAYDLAHGEYYGLNKDKDWGPYCIMGGWVMGYVPLALLAELGEPSPFACVHAGQHAI